MLEAATRFLDQLDAMLSRLDGQLELAQSRAEVANTLCEFVGRELNLADCGVYLHDGKGLSQMAAWGTREKPEPPGARIDLGVPSGIAGSCAHQLRPQRTDDARTDPRCRAGEATHRSELAVPILHGATLLGIIDSRDPEAGFYDARYEKAFKAMADRGAARLRELHR